VDLHLDGTKTEENQKVNKQQNNEECLIGAQWIAVLVSEYQ
jgi:hypothetical protein